jgi:hypothetical protein
LDPGIAGAYALLGATVLVNDLPVHRAQHGRSAKVRAELDLRGFRALLAGHAVIHCFIERVAARPGHGRVSMFRFDEAAGAVYGLIVGLGLSVTFAAPQQWQKHHRIGASPDAAHQLAVQLYRALAPKLALETDCHRADALLIGAYGLHRRGRDEQPARQSSDCSGAHRQQIDAQVARCGGQTTEPKR